ncbi:putative disease resistance protein RGA3, partial [Triticum dicoccoides]
MAAVLDALATRVMNTILDMGEEKISMLLGVSQEINKLEANMEPLRNLLTDAERRRITDRSVQAWVTKLKSAMYEASDILDLCQLEAMDRKDKQHSSGLCLRLREKLPFLGCLGDKLQGVLQPFLFCMQNPGFANEVGGRIKTLNEELATIRQGVANFKFIDLGSYEERRRPPTSSASYPKRENAQFVQSDLVGDQIKRNTEKLVQKLISTNRHNHGRSNIVNVVAIVGQGGIGKSTLAKKVFASEAIKEEFKTKIWLSVTQQFTKVDLLRAAISQAGGNKHGDEKDETILVNVLTNTLSNNKFLLVMDDVWNQQAWENVLRTPILNAAGTQPGSRVLVTSRMVDVVESMGASILRVNTLNNEDAWCLLKKQLPQPQ